MPETFAFLYNIQGGQLLLIIFVGLILFGGKKLPDLARSIGRAVHEFRRAATDVTQELASGIDANKSTESLKKSTPLSEAPIAEKNCQCNCQKSKEETCV